MVVTLGELKKRLKQIKMSDEVPNLHLLEKELKRETDPKKRKKIKEKIGLEKIRDKYDETM